MTPLFIKEFKKENKCPSCSKGKGQKSFCRQHLEVAKLSWRIWSANRRVKNICMNCNCDSVPLTGRCEKHRTDNKIRRTLFDIRNPTYNRKQAEAFIIKRREIKETGVCSCKAHHPLAEGRRYCKDCCQKKTLERKVKFAKTPELKKEYQALLLTLRTKVYQKNALRDLGKVPDNMQRLMELGYMTNHGKSWNTKQLFETKA